MSKVAIFVEDRLGTNTAGQIVSSNRRLEGDTWRALGAMNCLSVLCARVASTASLESVHTINGEVVNLPYYQGLRAAISKIPKMLFEAFRISRSVDLVVVKSPGLVGLVGICGAKLARKPIALHLVGDIEDSVSDARDSNSVNLLRWGAKLVTGWSVRQARAVRYPTRKFLQQKYPAISPESEFWFTDAAVTPVTEVSAVPQHVPGRIVAIGTQERMYKGHDFLIRALSQVKESVPTAHLVLVGQGEYRAVLEQLACEYDLMESVVFIDFLDGWESVSEMIRTANVFAMPSLAEGLPRSLLEAMSLGVACVGSDASGIPELLPEYLVVPRGTVGPLADLIEEILLNETLRLRAAEDCLQNSHFFAQDAMQKNISAWQAKLCGLIKDT